MSEQSADTANGEPSIVRTAIYSDFGYLFAETRDEFGKQDTYAFKPVSENYADSVRGLSSLDIEGTAVVPVASGAVGNHYHPSYDDKPDAVIEAVTDAGYTVVGHVDAGWQNWNGRPEFSENYADFGNAEIIATPEQ